MKIKTGLLVIGCFLLTKSASAQNWGGGVDDDELHFGFTFQYITSEYKILKKKYWADPYLDLDSQVPPTSLLRAISSKPSAGFGIGFVVNKRLSENADIRFTPSLVFNDRILAYEYLRDGSGGNTANIEKKTQATLVEFPLGFKLKSNRRNNFRAYMLGGAKYTMDISSRKKTNNNTITDPVEKFINNKQSYLSYEAGLGMDLYFEYFKMSPELKLSYSFNDILEHENHRYAAPIDKLMLRHVTFSLFFE
jgi:hypothetical protein